MDSADGFVIFRLMGRQPHSEEMRSIFELNTGGELPPYLNLIPKRKSQNQNTAYRLPQSHGFV